jgi:effector-binding domain-containing protein
MKKGLLIFISLFLVLLVAAVFFLPLTITARFEAKVALPINEISPQITDFRNWVKWYPGLADEDTTQISFSHADSMVKAGNLELRKSTLSPAAVNLLVRQGSLYSFQTIQLFPDSFGFATKVNWTEQLTPVNWIKYKFGMSSTSGSGLREFKKFADDPSRFFGFPIEIRPVPDPLVITKRKRVLKSQQFICLRNLYDDLFQFARNNHLLSDSNTTRLGAFNPAGNDSVDVMAGIPVAEKTATANGISYLEMPKNGKMLVGYYEGPYNGIRNLYTAMLKYVMLRTLTHVAAPFEKYLTRPKNAEDSLHMKIELYVPIL